MKYLLGIYIFLLPFHAVGITYLKCKSGIDTDILRFWKEFVVIILLMGVFFQVGRKNKWNFDKIFKNNYLLGVSVAFILVSFIYIYFPYFNPKISSYLGFKYDVFFIFTLLIGFYLVSIQRNFSFILKSIFASIALILTIFLPWYISGNIASTTDIFGFDSKPSTYEANGCISFAQNVTGGHHRFQGSFGDPIRFGVFLTLFYFIFLGFLLQSQKIGKSSKIIIGSVVSLVIFTSIFFSYTKTSFLGILFGSILFAYLVRRIIYKKTFSKKIILSGAGVVGVFLFIVLYIKRHLFLHPEAILGRVENLIISLDMFFRNPFGYGLGIAGPASQLGTSADESLSTGVTKFLPENWYVQILLEEGILGIALFIGLLCVIGISLWRIVKTQKDFLSIGIFTSFLTILFMANFTHVFEEAATSYTLFLIIGAYIAMKGK